MRLRWTLALAFVALAVLQVAVVVPLALRDLSTMLERQQDARIAQLMVAAEAERHRLEDHVLRAMAELAGSPALEEIARDAARVPPPPEVTTAASGLMTPRGLEVLALLDDGGRTLSSGHLPARLGEPEDPLFPITRLPQGVVRPVLVEVSQPSGLVQRPALVTVRAVDYGDRRVWAVGGVLLDDQRAAAFARLTGARVGIHASSSPPAPSADDTLRSLEFADVARMDLLFSRGDLMATQHEVLRGLLALAAFGLLLSVVAGFAVSRRVTRPVEALTEAARQIAAGAPGVTVDVRGASGELRALVASFNRMTEDLKTATDRLLASERVAAWQEVARRLAHEIKNPLTPIRMSLETLLAASRRDPDDTRFQALFKESAVAVLEEVERLKRIVDEFSQFARLPKPALADLNLTEAVQQVMALFAPHGAISYVIDLEPAVRVRGDRDQLTQVLVNLIKNAEEAMAGSSGGRCFVTLRNAGADAVLEVRDEGPGIPADLERRVFEPYVTTKPGGTGLGLAIAQRIAQEHDGRLDAANAGATATSRAGARFQLVLPRLLDQC